MNRKMEKIAIVGGGLSGLVMADALIEKGYERITLYEASSRLGGKLCSIEFKDRSYELGAIFGLPSQKHFKNLIKKLQIKVDGPKLSRQNYNAKGELAPQIPKSLLMKFMEEMERLPSVLNKYQSLKKPSLAGTEEEIMKPFDDWCDQHGFVVLKQIYAHYFTIFGLGPLEEVPAVYVHRILNYDHLMTFMEVPEFVTFQGGVNAVVKALEKRIDDLRLSQAVRDVRPYGQGGVLVVTDYEAAVYDKVIIAAPLERFSHLSIFNESIKKRLSSIKHQNFAVHLWRVSEIPEGCGCILDNLAKERRGHVTLWVNRWSNKNTSYLLTTYVYEKENTNRQRSALTIKEDLEEFGIYEPKLYQAAHWKHCPHFLEAELRSGIYDDLEDLQGLGGIYFIGETMSTLSMENAIAYAYDAALRFF